MSRTSNKNHTFYCRHSQVDKNAPCHGLHISEAELEEVLYEIMNKQAHRYPLWGKVFCGVCSHAMSRTSNKNHTFYCVIPR